MRVLSVTTFTITLINFFNKLNLHFTCCCFNSCQSPQSRNFNSPVQSLSVRLLSQTQMCRGSFRLCRCSAKISPPSSPPCKDTTARRRVTAPSYTILRVGLWRINVVSVHCLSSMSLILHRCFRAIGRCG